MFLKSASAAPLAIALFVSTAASSPFVKSVIDNQGKLCATYSGYSIQDIPIECVYQNFCVDLDLEPTQCAYEKNKNYDNVQSLIGMDDFCIQKVICGDQQLTKREETNKPGKETDQKAQDKKSLTDKWSQTLPSIQYPNKGIRPLANETSSWGKSCKRDGPIEDVPHECLYHHVCSGSPNYDCEVDVPRNKDVYTIEEIYRNKDCIQKLICAPRPGDAPEGWTSWKWEMPNLRLEENGITRGFYSGDEFVKEFCLSGTLDKVPRPCLYYRVCNSPETFTNKSCGRDASDSLFSQSSYTKKELVENAGCAKEMLCVPRIGVSP